MKVLPVSTLVLIVGISSASATTVTETTSDFYLIAGQSSAIAQDGSLTFDKFNPILGTLTSVEMYLSYFFASDIDIVNAGSEAQPASATSTMEVNLLGGLGLPLTTTITSASAPQSTSIIVPAGETYSLTHADLYLSSPPYQLTNFAAVTGIGTFDIDYSLDAGSLIAGASGTFSITAGLRVLLRYAYDPPEVEQAPIGPALPMLGSALLFLLPLRRRRD